MPKPNPNPNPRRNSSIVDNNWAVGTIIGIWGAKTGIIGATGRDQVRVRLGFG